MGMLRCGLVENEEASMGRFLGGLNREIYDILSYKEYNSLTRITNGYATLWFSGE
jgi:hypothetical protein